MMAQGYPTKSDYLSFLDNFSTKICQQEPDTCFYLYGSVPENRAKWAIADIDGGIIFPGNIQLDTKRVRNVSRLICDEFKKTGLFPLVRLQWNLFDEQTATDGRFLSYGASYERYFKREGKVTSFGNTALLNSIHAVDYRRETLGEVANTFRKARNVTLLFDLEAERNEERCIDLVRASLDRASKVPRKLLEIRTGNLIVKNPLEVLDDLLGSHTLGLESIQDILSCPEKYYEMDIDQAWENACMAVRIMEQLIDRYLQVYPTHDAREYRV